MSTIGRNAARWASKPDRIHARTVPAFRMMLVAFAAVAAETVVCWLLLRGAFADVVMVYLLGVVVMALRCGRVASTFAALLSIGAVDFFFTDPTFSFAVADPRRVLTLIVFLVVATVIADLTERVRLAAVAAKEREIEVRNERLRSALLSSVSHDLHTPLSVVLGAASALLDREGQLPADRRREYLVTIADEAARLSRLVRHLVDATALESGAVRARKEWMLLEEVVGVALTRVERALDARHVQVQIEPDASMITADATLLEQVFLNLLENAAKHTPPQTPVAISARRVDEGVEVAVSDWGHGVPRGLEERIFEKFERAERSRGGMGLGLTICRGIVAAHGGRMWCENAVGGGASFRFVLPRGEVPQLADAEE
jgi:two-component system sensor histidine kinase KdpD